ncbi:MAG: bifunctional DedA family/phosphatase PAP2 family protein, partial [Frankia sp.]
MTGLIDRLLTVPPTLALAVIFALPAAEASLFIGLIFPGEVAILLGGVLANEHRLALWTVIVAGSAGAIIGDSIGYEVGRHYGDRILARLPARLVSPQQLDRGRALLRRRGGRAIFLGRFTAALRALVPGLAGTSRLPYPTFLLFNVAGALVWVTETALVGYLVGKSYRTAEHRLTLISVGLLATIAAVVAFHTLRHSPRVRGWASRHLGFLFRLDQRLTAALLVMTAAGWLFAGLTQDVQAHEGLARSDPRLLQDIVTDRRSWLTPLAKVVTDLGTGPVIYAILVGLGITLWHRTRTWQAPVFALATLATGEAVRLSVNHQVARARPPTALWLVHPTGYAFPSGHTTTATIGYGLAAALTIRLWPRATTPTIAAAILLAVAVGLSRIYLGVHWPTDVAGGWTLGLAWLALAATLLALHRHRRKKHTAAPDPQPPLCQTRLRHGDQGNLCS